jgi:hypothetical protein
MGVLLLAPVDPEEAVDVVVLDDDAVEPPHEATSSGVTRTPMTAAETRS